ncbi:JmjC domain-containing protein [Pseudoduganella armeniaca]|uniref:JmjC domain-containing protein n=1 Tax=Pseudoduganella armeniaca TaxID=2072590 RepID=A0A2R4C683_9BURK|nr:cupin domain-containing protein [Pseudoduganella armeniaca]AVR95114.1 hypothetical protein C9I28_04790 [Pseudoduganella armeniaca]
MLIDFRCHYDEFKRSYFEKQPLLLEGAFTPPSQPVRIIEDALDVVDPEETYLKVLKNAERIDQRQLIEEYVDIGIRRRRIRKEALYRCLADDASLVLNRIDLYSQAVSDICLQVSRFARAQASANAYVSFGREPATDIHWDRHDIFAVQMFGEKRWLVYEPTFELPLNSQVSAEKKAQAPQTPVLDIVLKAGDVLYLPRGWWHKVAPVDDRPTFHLAVGAHTPLLLDYLVWACGNKLPDHLAFRKSVNGIDAGDGQLEQAIAALADILANPATLQDFRRRAQSRERVNSHVALADLFLSQPAEDSRRRRVQVNSRYAFDGAGVVVNGQRHVLTTAERMAVDFIAARSAALAGEVAEAIAQQGVADADGVLAGLLRRDIISHLVDL